MGLADRDYYRTADAASGARAGGLRTGFGTSMRWFSVNTWLIAICVAVYVVDGFLPIVDVPTGRIEFVHPDAAKLDVAVMVKGDNYLRRGHEVLRSLHEPGHSTQTPKPAIAWMSVMPMHWLTAHLHFSTRLAGFEFWRFIGFQFLHANLAHLMFNMIGLFFFGPIVEEYLGRKRYLAFYLLCGCCGALLYLILNGIGYTVAMQFGNIAIPGLLFSDPATPLVGASAGIFGVIMAGAYLVPNAIAFLLFIPMRLKTLAYGLVALAFFTVVTGGRNAGGEAGHLGGAIAGFYFIRRPHHLHNFFDLLGRADPTSHHYRPDRGRVGGTTDRSRSPALIKRWQSSGIDPREIDRILAKINREGLHSLSDDEKRTLAAASER